MYFCPYYSIFATFLQANLAEKPIFSSFNSTKVFFTNLKNKIFFNCRSRLLAKSGKIE